MARSKVKIVADILETVKTNTPSSKTTIIRLANLDWNMASEYLNKLTREGFLDTEETDTKGNVAYMVTEPGEILLKSLKKIRNVCTIF